MTEPNPKLTHDRAKAFCTTEPLPQPGQIWRHYVTGGLYEIISMSEWDSDRTPLVTYRSLGPYHPGSITTRRYEQPSKELSSDVDGAWTDLVPAKSIESYRGYQPRFIFVGATNAAYHDVRD